MTDTRPALEARLAAYEPGIDLVVVSYRSPVDLSRFVASLPVQIDSMPPLAPIDVRIVLVDPLRSDVNAALEATGKLLGNVAHQGRVAVANHFHGDNVGYNVACNAAGAQGRRRIIVCCNADVAFDDASPTLATMYDRLSRYEDWGMVGPRQVDRQGRLTAAGIFGTLRKPQHRGWRAADRGQCSDLRTDAVTVAGSVLAMRRDVWDELTACPVSQAVTGNADGPLLQTHHWWGETWACYHAAAHNYDRVYDGTVWCHHEHGNAPDSLNWARQNLRDDQRLFRAACDLHGLPHD